MDEFRIFRIVFKFLAEPSDIDSKCRHLGYAVGSPYRIEQNFLMNDLVRVLQKVDEDIELLSVYGNDLVTLFNRHVLEIDRDIFIRELLMLFLNIIIAP